MGKIQGHEAWKALWCQSTGEIRYCWAGLVRLCSLAVPRNKGTSFPTSTASHMMPLPGGGTTVLSEQIPQRLPVHTCVFPSSLGPLGGTGVQTYLCPRTARALPCGLNLSQLTGRDGSCSPTPTRVLGSTITLPPSRRTDPTSSSGEVALSEHRAFFLSHHVTL